MFTLLLERVMEFDSQAQRVHKTKEGRICPEKQQQQNERFSLS
jgi:hypothetical protein